MICPKCSFESSGYSDCPKCGINFESYLRNQNPGGAPPVVGRPAGIEPIAKPPFGGISGNYPEGISDLLNYSVLYVQQKEDALRIILGWQSKNQYVVLTEDHTVIGYLAEVEVAWWDAVVRLFLRAHRPFKMALVDTSGAEIYRLERPFFWFFSDLFVKNSSGNLLGSIQQRFAIFRKKYDLTLGTSRTGSGRLFARLLGSWFGGRTLWAAISGNQNFEICNPTGEQTGFGIIRTWNGILNRLFTDRDTYKVEMPPQWPHDQRLILLMASVAIDFDSFEEGKSAISEGQNIIETMASGAGAVTDSWSDNSGGFSSDSGSDFGSDSGGGDES